ncbi:MAG: LamG domain-containing protein [Limisphaerales bacterium]
MAYQLTNSDWVIVYTDATTTNTYHFNVTLNIDSNALPPVTVTFPLNGAINVMEQPTFTWQGPTNYNNLVVYVFNASETLPVTQTNWDSPRVLYQGKNTFTAHYDSNSVDAVVSSVPVDADSNTISSWVSTAHLQDYISSQFMVGTVSTLGGSHTLVARYTWDGTNADGSPAGTDISGNGYDLDLAGGGGSQGGVSSTSDGVGGSRGIQFHNGDGSSVGYVGWNTTPAPMLNALAGSFSVSCWIKTTQNFAWDDAPAYYGAGIISADNNGQANDVIPMALTGSKLGFNTGGNSEDVTMNSSVAINDGNYHQIVVTRNQATGQKTIYIDGVLDSFASGSENSLNDPKKLTIGALADAGDSNGNDFNYYNGFDGEMDDLQVYSGVLSASEVSALYGSPGSTIANGGGNVLIGGHSIVARYDFEQPDGSGVDSSGRNNDANCGGGSGDVHDVSSSDAAIGSYSRQFFGDTFICFSPGADSYNNLSNTLSASFTVSAWVKTTNSVGNDYDNAYFGAAILFAYNNNNSTVPMSITGSKVAITVNDHNGNSTTLHSQTSVNDGQYHQVVVSRNQADGTLKVYVDGNLEGTTTGTVDPFIADSHHLSRWWLGQRLHRPVGRRANLFRRAGRFRSYQPFHASRHRGCGSIARNPRAGGTLRF